MAKKVQKTKLTWKEKKINKIHHKTLLMFGVVPTEMLDSIDEEDFIKAEESPELEKELKEKLMSIYTIVPTRDEAMEFVRNHLILKHLSHYKLWCQLHNRKTDSDDSKDIYLRTVVDMKDPSNQYSIIDIKYTYEDLGIILRMSAGCAPIGCSYDNPAEVEAFLARESFRKKAEASTKKEVKDSTKKARRGRPKKEKEEVAK